MLGQRRRVLSCFMEDQMNQMVVAFEYYKVLSSSLLQGQFMRRRDSPGTPGVDHMVWHSTSTSTYAIIMIIVPVTQK